MRLRLREEAEVDYQVFRSNDKWWEHRARTLTTAGLISFFRPTSIIDPACGDASLVLAAHRLWPIERAYLADVSEPSIAVVDDHLDDLGIDGWDAFVGDAGEILDEAAQHGARYDVIVMTEFLEHIPDPVAILRKAKLVADVLIASSPIIDLPRGDPNPEHLWAFDNEGYLELFAESDWTPKLCNNLMLHEGYYNFQIWACEHG